MASIQGIYVALFGRPADPSGLSYFNSVTKNGSNLSGIGNLTGTAEYQSRFAGMSNEQVVNSIYQSLFGRTGETAGVQFWVQQLQSGRFNVNTIAIAILDGSSGTDLQTVTAKVSAADLFTSRLDTPAKIAAYAGNAAAQAAREFLTTVTKDAPGSVSAVDATVTKVEKLAGNDIGSGTTGGGVENVNAPPQFPSSKAEVSVAENTKGEIKGYIAAAKDPEGAVVTYSLADNQKGLFSIDSKTGIVSLSAPLDFENSGVNHSYSLTVVASDGAATTQQQLYVKVTDVNEAPVFAITKVEASVSENTTGPIAGYQASATDPEGAVLTYSLKDNLKSLFSIDSKTGAVSLNAPLDFENSGTNHSYSLTVIASDGSLTAEQELTIKVTDVNEAPAFSAGKVDVAVAENTTGPIAGYQAVAKDAEGAALTYSLKDNLKELFSIDSKTGVVSLNAPLDFENSGTNHSYSLTVIASDGSLTAEQELTVKVTDVNEAPAFTATKVEASIAENIRGQIPGYQASAKDPEGHEMTYSLSDNLKGLFSIDSKTGVISLNTAQNYESKSDSHSYVLTVNASDGNFTAQQQLTVNVTDVDEAPYFIGSTQAFYYEDSGWAMPPTLTAIDPEGGSVTFSLKDDMGGLFDVNPKTGFVLPRTPLDFEKQSAYGLTVVASDGKNTAEAPLFIYVLNVDEPPQFASAKAEVSVAENTKGPIAGYKAYAKDPEGHEMTYSLSDNLKGLFSIDSKTGVISLNTAQDYESQSDSHSYVLTVNASDGNFITQQILTVKTTDVDEAPYFIGTSVAYVYENSGDFLMRPTLTATDPEGGRVTFSLKDDKGGLFDINSQTGFVFPRGQLDFEKQSAYGLTVVASDGKNTAEALLSIYVMNLDEPPEFASSKAEVSVTENTQGPIAGYKASAKDPEGQQLTYSLSDNLSGLFSIDDKTGVVSVNTPLNYQSSGPDHRYTLIVNASDGNFTSEQEFTVNVTEASGNHAFAMNAAQIGLVGAVDLISV
ncbi:cadherin domain-containing protein [Rhizobium oryzicola]|uniref:Cadherin domain-containing protein n=1 Tax=Rhizobium oryzicola TaxID=1232668 RepID=A0ABT8SVI1_9HYPH|nr:cadherin domain-containing protein [Rhizobium oryzicola]MDO1582452.1 cadherin domain-containing protein [Rhizobium oryzicola]